MTSSYSFAKVNNAKKVDTPKVLSSMSDKEILLFLKDKGIEVPSDLRKNIPNIGQYAKTVIQQVEANPEWQPVCSYTITRDFANKIKYVVNSYYGIDNIDNNSVTLYATYTLQDSTVIGPWTDSYLNYNCYGHAIGKTNNFVNPGYYSNKPFSMNLSSTGIANYVVDDLNVLGYWAYTTSIKPTDSSLADYEKAICVRKGFDDYHFMKFGASWTHKPGNTAVLSYNYSSPEYKTWTNEGSFRGVALEPDKYYNSDVAYIIYWPKDVGPQPLKANIAENIGYSNFTIE